MNHQNQRPSSSFEMDEIQTHQKFEDMVRRTVFVFYAQQKELDCDPINHNNNEEAEVNTTPLPGFMTASGKGLDVALNTDLLNRPKAKRSQPEDHGPKRPRRRTTKTKYFRPRIFRLPANVEFNEIHLAISPLWWSVNDQRVKGMMVYMDAIGDSELEGWLKGVVDGRLLNLREEDGDEVEKGVVGRLNTRQEWDEFKTKVFKKVWGEMGRGELREGKISVGVLVEIW